MCPYPAVSTKILERFSSITSKVALNNLLRKAINVKNKGKLRKYGLNFIASLSKLS